MSFIVVWFTCSVFVSTTSPDTATTYRKGKRGEVRARGCDTVREESEGEDESDASMLMVSAVGPRKLRRQ